MSHAAEKKLHRTEISKTDGENPQLESHHQDKLEALSALIKINTAIGFMPMNLKASLRFLVDETKTLFDAHGCAIFSLDGDVNFDVVFSGSPDMEVGLPKRFGNTQQCLVVRDELPFIVQDAARQDKGCCGLRFGERIESFVCLPVSAGNKLVGVLVVGSLKKRAFSTVRRRCVSAARSSKWAAAVTLCKRTLPFAGVSPRSMHYCDKAGYRANEDCNVERQLDEGATSARTRVAGRKQSGCARAAGDQAGERGLSCRGAGRNRIFIHRQWAENLQRRRRDQPLASGGAGP